MEALAVLGAIASIVQIVEVIGKLSGGIIDVIDRFKSFSEELRRIKLTIESYRPKLEILILTFIDQSNEAWLTPRMLNSFKSSLLEVQTDVKAVAVIIKNYDSTQQGSISFRKKLRYQLCDQKTLSKCSKHLESSEKNLQRMESMIHM